ncbi:peptidoglycan/xylan/chitin deacetylase (PgdA/CDA1 family) [Deinobacterium chartae]|uniref:Peptidoglycan/xylan/chitin deacetylase (PgdA/CDA1 family) n=1 Tax=Deinobacterium chartae TaxID=521158 RepID=A0A841I2B1_9DEIO|nr:polysaccharide deacetylase family protein [Deinobacterium chartae]MBB6099134.1 peptidoglycan/xylan/chitin deacetylase (PgdA/CDA1 family) [Deinobacterium chartae]
MKRTFKWGLAGAGLYLLGQIGLPYLLLQLANLGVLREGQGGKPEFALTFDDGPDPETTPRVLAALREAGVKATFFVVGERARQHPDLVRQILEEGHEVGSHGYRHRHAWFRWPWSVGADLRRSLRVLEDITGERPKYFRPPHGAYTASTWLALRGSGVIPVHWNLEAHDWSAQYDAARVVERMLAKAEPGTIAVMHDAGPGGRTAAEALPGLIAELKNRGYSLVPLGKLYGPRLGDLRGALLRLWVATVEEGYRKAHHLDDLTQHSRSIFRVTKMGFTGPTVVNSEGEPIEAGTPAGELHLHSVRLVRAAEISAISAYRMMNRSLEDLARLAETPKYQDAQLFFGISLFHEVLAPLGFGTAPLDNPLHARFMVGYMNFLRRLYSGGPTDKRNLEAKLVYIDRKTLLERHGKKK